MSALQGEATTAGDDYYQLFRFKTLVTSGFSRVFCPGGGGGGGG